jgi:hypothetical protein
MRVPPSPLSLLALLAPAAVLADRPVQAGQLTIRERVIIRVPRMPLQAAPVAAPTPIKWKERKGPKCIAAQGMAGAMVTSPRQVDLVLIGGKRVRAKLDGACRPLDFYAGFYLRPARDGMICADRDAIKVRSGASCGIDEFKALVPAK